MKLTATMLLITCLHAAAHMKGQTVTLSLKNVPVQKVFKEMSRQTGISIVYNEGMLEGIKPVSIKVTQATISAVLEQCLEGQPFEYTLVGKTIVIKKKAPVTQPFLGFTTPPPPPEIKGKVLNEKGEPIAGANVSVKGTRRGAVTDINGEFSVEASKGDKLIVSFVGYTPKELTVGEAKNVSISLELSSQELGELVVTALGIQRRQKSLTYSTQKINNAELTTVKDINPINSLNGKVAGLQINRSASGLGGSVRVVLRGQKSTRENQPLFVIDGVPMANVQGSQPMDVWGQSSGINSIGRDGGDILSTINPEDIESITVLKGASASALYGSQAGNGVILITTKKGKAGVAKIDFSSNFTMEKPMYYPESQFSYKQTVPGDIYSWGAEGSSPDHVKPFFETGTTWINTLALTAGNEKAQTYFSYSNTSNKGVMPTSEFGQHTFNFRESAKFLNDKLLLDANILFSTQKSNNRPASGLYFNPLTGLYLFPRGLDFNSYKNYERFSTLRNLPLQNWWNIDQDNGVAGADNQQNPYWVLHRNLSEGRKDNLFSSLTIKYPITKWLNVQARGSINRNYDDYEFKAFAGTQMTLADSNGRYTADRMTNTLLYGDLIVSGNLELSQQFGFSFNVGTSINDLKQDRDFFDTKGADLQFANIFTVGNIRLRNTAMVKPSGLRRQVQSIFGTATIDYNDKIYLDLTARNDWSSTLAFTSKEKTGYPYFSAGLNTIISDLVTLPDLISYSKVRVSYAKVGNDVAPFATRPVYTVSSGQLGSIQVGAYKGAELRPEDTRSLEIGTEWRLLNNRLNIDFTWYKSNTKDQYFEFSAPRGSGVSRFFVNAGDIENKGIELALSYDVLRDRGVRWTTGLNLTRNVNKVLKLLPELGGQYEITKSDVNNYSLRISEGGAFGDIYGKKFQRAADGSIVVDADGKPQGAENFEFLGNPTPKFLAGWNNTVEVSNFVITALIDGRFGGKVMSVTQALMDEYGVSEATANARKNGGVNMPATKIGGGKWTGPLPADIFYKAVGGRAGITENYMYDATNVRLRELSIGYKVPSNGKVIKDIRLGLVARNLFFITKDAPYDPELSMSTGNGLQGIDVFSLPATRSIGASFRCSF